MLTFEEWSAQQQKHHQQQYRQQQQEPKNPRKQQKQLPYSTCSFIRETVIGLKAPSLPLNTEQAKALIKTNLKTISTLSSFVNSNN